MTKKFGVPPEEETKRLASQLVDAAKKNGSSLTRIAFLLGFDEICLNDYCSGPPRCLKIHIKRVEYHPAAVMCCKNCFYEQLLTSEKRRKPFSDSEGREISFNGSASFCPACGTLWINLLNALTGCHPGHVLAFFLGQ